MTKTVKDKIAIIGLGYVGLPLAVALAREGVEVVGFDTNSRHVDALHRQTDTNGEVSTDSLKSTTATFTSDAQDLAGCTAFIIAVPTPITDAKKPDLSPMLGACKVIAPHLTKGTLVVVESTVYPGVTEEICGPALADQSGLRMYDDIKLGYSPERINPGDAEHSLENVVKIISAQDDETLDRIEGIYAPLVKAGLHRASSIKTAEAAKVIENTQRDLNIALVNEFALIFSRLGLDTLEVLKAAGTKWNFLPFRPGLVGGHCIGVDPYYLTYKAEQTGYHPEVILAGRRINDHMGRHIAQVLVKEMLARKVDVTRARVLVLGFTFKENCADTRNTKVVDILDELSTYSISADVYDPWVSPDVMQSGYGITPVQTLETGAYDGIILAVAHSEFVEMGADKIRALGRPNATVYDLKGVLGRAGADLRP